MPKIDLRIVKTRKAIKEAFISLVEENGFENVKIKDITERALINRNTFYLHYYSKENLISAIIEDEINSQIPEFTKLSESLANRPFKHLEEIIEKLLELLNEKIEFYRILLTDPALSGYINYSTKELSKKIVEKLNIDDSYDSVAIKFTLSGFIGVLADWVVYDTDSIKNTAIVLTKIGMACLKTAKKLS